MCVCMCMYIYIYTYYINIAPIAGEPWAPASFSWTVGDLRPLCAPFKVHRAGRNGGFQCTSGVGIGIGINL